MNVPNTGSAGNGCRELCQNRLVGAVFLTISKHILSSTGGEDYSVAEHDKLRHSEVSKLSEQQNWEEYKRNLVLRPLHLEV